MEHKGAASEGSWSSFDIAVPDEESEMMAQLLGSQYFSNEQEHEPSAAMRSMFWPNHDAASSFRSTDANNSSIYWHQANSGATSSNSTSNFLVSTPNYEGHYLDDINLTPSDYCASEEQITISSIQDESPANLRTKRMFHTDDEDDDKQMMKAKDDISLAIPRKKTRALLSAPKRAKNSKSKKAQQKRSISAGNEEDSNADVNGLSSSHYSSEDDSSASQDLNEGSNARSTSKRSADLKGKTRADRGSATDPQSLYARKRRERINERLKVLQNLVPNGTKVDISTMLEEAVQYVKFLQVQIKLLSSDDLWMYAPIAYNGFNVGLDLKISPP
ncbi:uncharacterized protein [Typha angustifolia]|uniref:uncharacterized protein n=1 Tax=Typha angustifolia TaxID=59011 RepID=UPI003C2CF68D